MAKDGVRALEKFRRKFENAYHDRCIKGQRDYPPYKLTPWEDRAAYHHFVLILIDESIEEQKTPDPEPRAVRR